MQRHAAGWKDDAATHLKIYTEYGIPLGNCNWEHKPSGGRCEQNRLEVNYLVNMVNRDVEFPMSMHAENANTQLFNKLT
jgi:hypothetical protein